MKTLLLCFFYFTISLLAASGQTLGGIKGGLNVSNLIISNKPDAYSDSVLKALVGYQLGCFIQDDISRQIAWKIEMLFSKKGYVSDFEGIRSNVPLNYLSWPFLLVYKPGERLEAEAGIEFGYLISGTENYNSFDIGIDVGFLYRFFPKCYAGLRYNLGIPSTLTIPGNSSSTNLPKYQHSVLQITLGFNLIRTSNPEQ